MPPWRLQKYSGYSKVRTHTAFGFRVHGSGLGVQDSGFRIQGSGCDHDQTLPGEHFLFGFGLRVQGSGSRVPTVGCMV